MRVCLVAWDPYARSEVRSSKAEEKCEFVWSRGTLTREVKFDRQNAEEKSEFVWSRGTLTHEVKFHCQKLKKECGLVYSKNSTF